MNQALPMLSADLLAQAQAQALQQQRPTIEVLEELLPASGAVDEVPSERLISQLAHVLHYRLATMRDMREWQVAFDIISYNDAQQKECLAFYDAQRTLLLVFADPFNAQLPLWAQHQVAQPFEWRLAHRLEISAYLAGEEDSMRAMDGVGLSTEQAQEGDEEVVMQLSLKSIHEDANPIVKLINSTLYDALKTGASDIHLETHAGGLAVKYRIDGVMANIANSPGLEGAEQAISRIKVMAQLDIAERRVPQDGRFKVHAMGRLIDFRVSIMPSVFGEDAVLRVLDRKALTEQAQGLSLKALGFDQHIITGFRKLASEPYGMVLVTGPTGSGKTTSLYAAISEVNTGFDKIITIEDPVEYQLPGVLQIPVNEKKGLTFARGLRSILRHDPDKIMVGEIRDADTAQIAVQAALTGHLVFSTVHANSVLDVIGRFMHMGVDPYHFVSAVNGIIAQRLVRALCPHCAEPFVPDAAMLKDSGLSAEQAAGMQFTHAQGCGHCRGTGYKGRKAVAEMLVLNDELREMIIARQPIRQLKEAAARNGMRTIREAAIQAVAEGMTSLQEINRVTFIA
ncbi:GspE/PulE family protein [Methylophilus medardicus]|uniref:Type II/IV secretion system protein n=1 Tax=Methylophilus medardicus TaxID=2588534 RepID=A0A5B8CTQ5_9PROT|nr:GspE/PulE family protein [Methylophilus medardicus]QDC44698.1 type II/IV secretion system protein [Methylophilus medardicus]QDC49705.1 type II/IV secretion system protein [Methylophilus medardicus]QDC53410.1 type II/IV secretion system protein [Methylophilus medardicus]